MNYRTPNNTTLVTRIDNQEYFYLFQFFIIVLPPYRNNDKAPGS